LESVGEAYHVVVQGLRRIAILLNCYVAFSLWGIVGLILSILLVPAAYFLIPLYVLVKFGEGLPIMLAVVLPIVLGIIEFGIRKAVRVA
jgi:hypothetical protein